MSLPYHEPDIQTILILVSFIILLNLINHALDKILYCGLLGQVVLVIVWGTPGSKLLSLGAEELIVNLGYLGLLLIVYGGGPVDYLQFTQSESPSFYWGRRELVLRCRSACLFVCNFFWMPQPYKHLLQVQHSAQPLSVLPLLYYPAVDWSQLDWVWCSRVLQ